MGFLDNLKDKAGDVGDKAKEGLGTAREKAADLVEDVKDRLDGDDDTPEAVTTEGDADYSPGISEPAADAGVTAPSASESALGSLGDAPDPALGDVAAPRLEDVPDPGLGELPEAPADEYAPRLGEVPDPGLGEVPETPADEYAPVLDNTADETENWKGESGPA